MSTAKNERAWTKGYDYGAAALILALAAVLSWLQGKHQFLTPPFENDFVGFAERARSLAEACELNGFYPLGYPLLLLSLTQPSPIGRGIGEGDAAFAAAKIAAIWATVILATAAYLLSGALLGKPRSFLTLVTLAVNPYFWQSAFFVGTDMPWAALQCLALLGCTLAIQRQKWPIFALAGMATGLAYLMRYTALLTLPVVCAYLMLARPLTRAGSYANLRGALAFTVLFLLFSLPQLWISWQAKGNPFFNLQAKNVWFGIYGNSDWWTHWREVPSDISLGQVFLTSPGRFLGHWGQEFIKWWAYTGVLAVGASLLAYQQASPAIRLGLLAMTGFLGVGVVFLLLQSADGADGRRHLSICVNLRHLRILWPGVKAASGLLGFYYVIYGLSVALVFVQPRFFLAVLPLILAAAVTVFQSADFADSRRYFPFGANPRHLKSFRLLLGLAFLIFAAGNGVLTLHHYLDRLQPPVAEVVHSLQDAGAHQEDVILASLEMPYKYHTLYNFQPLPREARSFDLLYESLRSHHASFLLFEEAYGARYWPALSGLLQEPPAYLRLVWQGENQKTALYRVTFGD